MVSLNDRVGYCPIITVRKNAMKKISVFVCLVLSLLAVLSFGCLAQEDGSLTKDERLKNTLYFQHMNYTAAKDGVMTVIDVEDKSFTPVLRNGVFYIPLRFTAESFGITVGWEDETKSVLFTVPDKTVRLSTKDNLLSVGESTQNLENECFIENGHTFIAIGDIGKLIKCSVHFYSGQSSAVIAVGEEWDFKRDAEKQALSAMEFAVSPFFKMFT